MTNELVEKGWTSNRLFIGLDRKEKAMKSSNGCRRRGITSIRFPDTEGEMGPGRQRVNVTVNERDWSGQV
ncbi:hypothetical protein PM082_007729 [Marasmius tenuissimus]|nr:hypothetical protein PM082_007729 [Marasmius tenuissimus]